MSLMSQVRLWRDGTTMILSQSSCVIGSGSIEPLQNLNTLSGDDGRHPEILLTKAEK